MAVRSLTSLTVLSLGFDKKKHKIFNFISGNSLLIFNTFRATTF